MQTDPLKNHIASIISKIEKTEIESLFTSRFSWLFASKNMVYKVRRDQPNVVTSLPRNSVQRLAEIEFERGRLFSIDLYKGLMTIEAHGQNYCVLVLRRMQDDKLLCNIYRKRLFNSRSYSMLTEGLNKLHENSDSVKLGNISKYMKLTWEFLDRTSHTVKTPLDRQLNIKGVIKKLSKFFDDHVALFQEREESGFVLDTHGDLHSANIFLVDKAIFIDPAVASPHMYQIDYLHQIADVMLDLLACKYSKFIPKMMEEVVLVKFDTDAKFLLSHFYLPLRALLRVVLWQLYQSSGLTTPLPTEVHFYSTLATDNRYIELKVL